jgi:integrase
MPTLGTFSLGREGDDMPKPSKRDGWHLAGGKWTRSLGQRGTKVRLFQKRREGTFYRAVWVPQQGKSVACLHTGDREQAEKFGCQLLASLLTGEVTTRPSKVTLGELWDRYRGECATFLDNKQRTRKDADQRASVLLGFFGRDCDVRHLSTQDQAAYTRARLAGGIQLAEDRRTVPVRARSAEADLILLHSMLAWATTVRLVGGARWLDSNPLGGVRRVREPNPKRPVATWERYQASRKAMQQLAGSTEVEAERLRWVRLELALVLAEATGRRLGSVRQLRWEDVDFQRATIRWRAEADKKGRESVVPVPAKLLDELRTFQRKLGAVGGWVFAAEKLPDQPMDRHLFDKWLSVAERQAKLPKLDGGLWHPYRRKWATERKGHSLRDVAAAGGWKDTDTLLQCYQQPDTETLLAVMSEERKLREAACGA